MAVAVPNSRAEAFAIQFKEDNGEVDARMIRSRAEASVEGSEQGLEVEEIEKSSDQTSGMNRSKAGVEIEEVRMVLIPGGFKETKGVGLAARAVSS